MENKINQFIGRGKMEKQKNPELNRILILIQYHIEMTEI